MEYPGWMTLCNDALVHESALIGFPPMRSATFARAAEVIRPDRAALPDGCVVYGNIVVGPGASIGPRAIIYSGASIGAGTQICPNAHIREGVVIGRDCVVGMGVSIGYHATIGNRVQMMDYSHISGGTVIGDGTFISVNVVCVNDDKPGGYVWKGITPARIGRDCVIGAGALIRPGVRIGDRCVIAMGAVVTRDVRDGVTVMGLPARETVTMPVDPHAVAVDDGTAMASWSSGAKYENWP